MTADVNPGDEDNFTPLHWAAHYDKTEMVKFLLRKGAQVNARSTVYGSPLIVAAQYGFTETVKVLIEKSADVHLTDGSGRTALSYAEDGKFEPILHLLKSAAAIPRSTNIPVASISERAFPSPPPVSTESSKVAEKPEAAPITDQQTVLQNTSGSRITSPVKVSVFHFKPLNMEASHYGVTASGTLTAALKTEPLFVMLDRKDLETFLSINDLQQDERTENAINIGMRMGLNFVVTGSIEQRGSLIITNCNVISIDHRKVVLQKQSRSFGETSLIGDMKKLGNAIISAIAQGT